MTDKLKPCPFCGGEAFEYYSGSQFEICEVVCKECGCRSKRKTEAEAIAAWNKRSYIDDIVEQLEEKKTKFSFPKHCKSIGVCPPEKTCSECIVEKFVEDIIAIVKGVQNE